MWGACVSSDHFDPINILMTMWAYNGPKVIKRMDSNKYNFVTVWYSCATLCADFFVCLSCVFGTVWRNHSSTGKKPSRTISEPVWRLSQEYKIKKASLIYHNSWQARKRPVHSIAVWKRRQASCHPHSKSTWQHFAFVWTTTWLWFPSVDQHA